MKSDSFTIKHNNIEIDIMFDDSQEVYQITIVEGKTLKHYPVKDMRRLMEIGITTSNK